MATRQLSPSLTDSLISDFSPTLAGLQQGDVPNVLTQLCATFQAEAVRVHYHLAAMLLSSGAILGLLTWPFFVDDFLSRIFWVVAMVVAFSVLCLTPLTLYVLVRVRRRPEYREKLLRFLSGGRREVLAKIVEPCLKRAHPEHLNQVLPLCLALEKKYWWESAVEKRARFVAVSTLHSLLGAATEDQITAFSPSETDYLKRELVRWLSHKTGWYLDTELPIRFFLVLGSARASGLEELAKETARSHTEPRLVEAAREYLYALGVA